MALTFETSPVPAEWNARIAATPNRGNLFQSFELGEIKRMARWTPRYAVADGVAMTIHEKSAPGFGTVWYVPKGPCVADTDQLRQVVAQLTETARAEGVLFIRVEPEIPETPEAIAAIEDMGLVRTHPVQPNTSTVIHALPASEDELIASYPSKTRNMVRRAIRDGVVKVERAPDTDETYEVMWSLWQEVVHDQELAVRSKDYHVRSWQIMVRAGIAQVLIARADDTPVASALITCVGDSAAYKEGASLRERPVPGVSQLVQYEGMRWAIERGARTYDMIGVPHSSELDDPSHPRHGIGKFKRGFTKDVIDWVGAWDIVLRPRRYAVWGRLGERVVARVQRREPGDTFW
ncbi:MULTISPECIES: lipid II:glycine glycyltransferase FemX [unclassified Ornithinimicrobium]|uniref:lipid II:glycine glycyltransferase FemX n=1 Tax=unclassified Ornithinimicrobium TaxID=2615080 RepID=UPI003852E4D7